MAINNTMSFLGGETVGVPGTPSYRDFTLPAFDVGAGTLADTSFDTSAIMAGGPEGTGSGVPQGGGFLSGLSGLTGAIGNLLGGTGGQLLGAGLSLDYLNEARQSAREAIPMFQDIAARGQEAAAFRPFTVSTGFGGVTTTPEGGFTTTLSPAMAAQQQALQGITSGLLGGMGGLGSFQPQPRVTDTRARLGGRGGVGVDYPRQVTGGPAPLPPGTSFNTFESPEQAIAARISGAQPSQAPMAPSTGGFGAGIPDVSGIQRQALGGVGGFLTGAMAPMGAREADVYERIRATQRPEEERQRLALEERLAAQGRTGLRTAQFGGSPEQLALAQAQEEAKARASLGALGQAQAEQLQQMGMAESLFGLGGRAAALPASLQLGQLQNIGLAQAAQYQPEQQLLASLTPALSLADIARTGQQYGAGLMAEAEAGGLENLLQTEAARMNALQNIYGNILGSAAAQRQGQPQTSLVSDVSGLFSALRDFF